MTCLLYLWFGGRGISMLHVVLVPNFLIACCWFLSGTTGCRSSRKVPTVEILILRSRNADWWRWRDHFGRDYSLWGSSSGWSWLKLILGRNVISCLQKSWSRDTIWPSEPCAGADRDSKFGCLKEMRRSMALSTRIATFKFTLGMAGEEIELGRVRKWQKRWTSRRDVRVAPLFRMHWRKVNQTSCSNAALLPVFGVLLRYNDLDRKGPLFSQLNRGVHPLRRQWPF